MLFLTNLTHIQVLSVTFIEYGQNVNKHNISDKAMWGKMGGVYVTCVADADKQQHVVFFHRHVLAWLGLV